MGISRSSGRRRLFKLRSGGTYGRGVSHDYLVARRSVWVEELGQIFRRPTLDEYVVLMNRVPVPTYPKDGRAMVAMMDVMEGSTVLEAGSGSGGLTLYLSQNGNALVFTRNWCYRVPVGPARWEKWEGLLSTNTAIEISPC